MYKFLTGIFAAIIAFTSAIGIPVYKEETGFNTVVAEIKENISLQNGKTEVSFDKQPVNTVEITFGSSSYSEIKIYNSDEIIYYRASCDKYRFCAFDTVETDLLAIEITGDADVESITVSCKQSDNADFRVTSYFVSQNITGAGSVNPDAFNVITDAILFGCVTFNENAEITVDKSLLEPALANLRNAIGDRDVNVYVNILGPGSDGGISDWYDQMANQAEKHSKAFATGLLEERLTALLDDYGFDGIFFDYEYPIESKYWNDFSRFLIKLNKTTDKKIGIAIAQWDIGLTYRAIKAVDMIELMQYDLFDEQGNHSSLTSAIGGFNAVRDYLIPRGKADLGVPFYGRPSTKDGYWPSYSQYADVLNPDDSAETDGGKAYFNSPQTIYDKTAYALSRGLGGMMVWHYSCDTDFNSDNSLFSTMQKCINDRIITS